MFGKLYPDGILPKVKPAPGCSLQSRGAIKLPCKTTQLKPYPKNSPLRKYCWNMSADLHGKKFGYGWTSELEKL